MSVARPRTQTGIGITAGVLTVDAAHLNELYNMLGDREVLVEKLRREGRSAFTASGGQLYEEFDGSSDARPTDILHIVAQDGSVMITAKDDSVRVETLATYKQRSRVEDYQTWKHGECER